MGMAINFQGTQALRSLMTTEAKWSDFTSFDGAQTLSAANQLLPRWVALILVVVLAWQLSGIIWMLVPGSFAGDPVAVGSGLGPARIRRRPDTASRIRVVNSGVSSKRQDIRPFALELCFISRHHPVW